MGSVRDGRLPQLFASLGFLNPTPSHDSSAHCSPIPIISPLLDFLGVGQTRLDNIMQERRERVKKIEDVRKVVKEMLEAFRKEERCTFYSFYKLLFNY